MLTYRSNEFFLISGCSGGGKSTLLSELAARGHATIEEPGRRIVVEERAGSGAALPWVDPGAFAGRAIAMSRADLSKACEMPGPVFFDRGLIDAALGLQEACGVPYRETIGETRPYARCVFLAPPWPEIFTQDEDRRHSLGDAIAEFERLSVAFDEMGYDVCLLPKTSVAARADFVLEHLQTG